MNFVHTSHVSEHAQTSSAERRRGLRIRRDHPVKIFSPSANRYLPGQTLDVSSTGLRVTLPASAPFLPGHHLSIHVGLNPSGNFLVNRAQMLPARIVWIDRDSTRTANTLTAGIEFVSTLAAHLDAA
jgi:hypothetical protein